ncbi:MAG: hypothetical protein ACOX2K_08350 [Bacillota bacterium]
MKGAALVLSVTCWLCALVFISMGQFALKRRSPMHFWAGTTVQADEISDVRAYNRANAVMWFTYGALFALAGVCSALFDGTVGGIMVGILSLPGLFVLVFVYSRIYRKYRVKR